ncbi:aminodeoxychorismate lyase [Collinsella sp. An2]|nr:aminodeoxychorismate lyase [Collinsella sp. An2]
METLRLRGCCGTLRVEKNRIQPTCGGTLVANATHRSNQPERSPRRAVASSTGRPAGTRFKQPQQTASGATARTRTSARQTAGAAGRSHAARPAAGGARPIASSYQAPARKKSSPVPVIIALVVAVAAVALVVGVVIPSVASIFTASDEPAVAAGQEVQVTIPEGASGDQIASVLSTNHIIEDPKNYYAAVRQLNADALLKPGDYLFTTGQDPLEVVQQLVDGPNVQGVSLTIQEGLTVQQTADRVEEVYGIPADDFLAQAKASNYVADYPFLEGAYNDSLEGYLYPKTYSFSGTPTSDDIIRALLDQFEIETADLDLASGANGLTSQELISLASLVERETAVEDERPIVASVIYNRLAENMPLQIDAAIVYARGGGSQSVTYDDLKIDSPYNIYENTGLTPGPICSPSISSIQAAVHPADTSYLYYVLSSANDGTHKFSESYDEFLTNRQEYLDSRS